MRDMILAMREKWLHLLLTGEKTAEVRRTSPRGEVMQAVAAGRKEEI